MARNRGDRGAIHAGLGDRGHGCVREPVTEVERKPAVFARRDTDERPGKPLALRGVVRAHAHA
jgi:hypothetical protein